MNEEDYPDPESRHEAIKDAYLALHGKTFNYFAVADKITPGSELEAKMLAVLNGERDPITSEELGIVAPDGVLI